MLWVALSLLMAAAIAPWLYQSGKALAAATSAKELPGIVEWLGAACGRADFSRYFSRALAASAVVLLPALFRRIRWVRSADGCPGHPCCRLPWRSALLQIAVGCVIAGGILWITGILLEEAGAYVPKQKPLAASKILGKILMPALVVPPLEEWLFRGLLLGLWLKLAKPGFACVGTSLVFAVCHFLKLPEGSVIANPAAPWAGFELLGKVLLHFTDPRFFVTEFATLFVIGMILAWSRLRTGALWFAIGLHAGWIFAFKGFNHLHATVGDHPLRPWGVGDSLNSGVFPLLALGVTAMVCHFALRGFEVSRASR